MKNNTAIIAVAAVAAIVYIWMYHRQRVKRALNNISTSIPTSLVDNSGGHATSSPAFY